MLPEDEDGPTAPSVTAQTLLGVDSPISRGRMSYATSAESWRASWAETLSATITGTATGTDVISMSFVSTSRTGRDRPGRGDAHPTDDGLIRKQRKAMPKTVNPAVTRPATTSPWKAIEGARACEPTALMARAIGGSMGRAGIGICGLLSCSLKLVGGGVGAGRTICLICGGAAALLGIGVGGANGKSGDGGGAAAAAGGGGGVGGSVGGGGGLIQHSSHPSHS